MPDAANRLGTEPVGKLLFRFSLPAIAGMLANALYNVVDRIFVGRGVGGEALGGLALVMPLMTIALAFAMLFGIGAANMISMRLGQKRKEDAENALNHCFFLLLGAGILMIVLGQIFIEPLLSLLGTQEDSTALDYARSYLRIILLGSVFSLVGFGLSHCTRAQGFPVITMIAMLLGAVLNIILDAVFIFVFKWGVEGAAWATVISLAASNVWILSFCLGKKAVVGLRFKTFKPSFSIVRQIMAFGSAQFLLQFLMSGVQLLYNKSMGWYGAAGLEIANGGDIALSGMTIVGSVTMLILMPVFGINQGAQPILGYNYGAKQYSRVLRAYVRAVLAATAICSLGFTLAQLFPEQLAGFFVPQDLAAINGQAADQFQQILMEFTPRAMRIMLLLLPLAGFQIISVNLFVVTGRPKTSIFLSLLRQCLALIPLLFIFGRVWGLWGVIAAAPVTDTFAFLVTGVMIIFELRKLTSAKQSV